MFEYTLDMYPEIKEKLQKKIDKLANIKSVKRMNKILFKCKDLVVNNLHFKDTDQHHNYLKQSLI